MHSSDRINDHILLPELNIGEWLYYENTGAYTVCLQTKFCGFPSTVVYYYCTDEERYADRQAHAHSLTHTHTHNTHTQHTHNTHTHTHALYTHTCI